MISLWQPADRISSRSQAFQTGGHRKVTRLIFIWVSSGVTGVILLCLMKCKWHSFYIDIAFSQIHWSTLTCFYALAFFATLFLSLYIWAHPLYSKVRIIAHLCISWAYYSYYSMGIKLYLSLSTFPLSNLLLSDKKKDSKFLHIYLFLYVIKEIPSDN